MCNVSDNFNLELSPAPPPFLEKNYQGDDYLAKVIGPLYSILASGKFADIVIFLSCMEGIFVQSVYPGNVPDTENQWKNQAAISITNELYSIPGEADWQAWENRVGPAPLTGNNLFTSLANKAHHREVSFNVISAVTLNRLNWIAKNPDSNSHSSSSDLDSSDLDSSSLEVSPQDESAPNIEPPSDSANPADLNPEENSCSLSLTFKCRYDSLILISLWPKGSPPLSLTDHLPLPETAEPGKPIPLSSGNLLIPFQARGWDNLETRKLDWNSWDWESWNQAKENGNPLKIVTDSSSQGPLNQIEITGSGLQPDQQYFCRLTELPRLLTGPPDLTATVFNANSDATNSSALDKDTPSDTLDKDAPSRIQDENAPQEYLTRAKIALDSAPAALVYAVTCCLPDRENDSISYVIIEDSPVSLSPETYLNLSWQAMPEASNYNVYRTFSSAGLPCGFLGQTTSTSYQDQGQVIQNFSLPTKIKPCYLIDGDSGYYLFST